MIFGIGVMYEIIGKTSHIARTHGGSTDNAVNFPETLHLKGTYKGDGYIDNHVISFETFVTVGHECCDCDNNNFYQNNDLPPVEMSGIAEFFDIFRHEYAKYECKDRDKISQGFEKVALHEFDTE